MKTGGINAKLNETVDFAERSLTTLKIEDVAGTRLGKLVAPQGVFVKVYVVLACTEIYLSCHIFRAFLDISGINKARTQRKLRINLGQKNLA